MSALPRFSDVDLEGEGFEPRDPLGPPAFEAGAFSRTPPPLQLHPLPMVRTARVELATGITRRV